MALAAPGYPAYRNILSALGLEPVLIEVGPNAHYQPNPDCSTHRSGGDIAGLIVASPANPTGTMIPAAELARLAAWCRERDIRLVSDEIYHGITYETPAQTARAFGRDIVVVNSFSKYYSMTGWRLGWMLVPPELARSVECLAQNFYVSPPALSQLAAPAGVRLPRRTRRACRALPRQPRSADRDARRGRARPASRRPRGPSTCMSMSRT